MLKKHLAKHGKSSKVLLSEVRKLLHHYFPDLKSHIDLTYKDPRRKKSCTYSLSELVLAAVFMYMQRSGSRSKMNDNRTYKEYRRNYRSLFGLKLPHMDTVDSILERLDEEVLSQIQKHLLSRLMKKRVFHKFRLMGKYFTIAIDGTGIFRFSKEPYLGCPYKESKNGKKVYIQSIVEAKLVMSNGFSLSIGTEWILNSDGKTKQDCEQNATKRLLARLKKEYKRLPICIVLDGLYANQPTMNAIKILNGWEFIVVWKDKTLYRLQDEVEQHREQNLVVQNYSEVIHNAHSRTENHYEYDPMALSNLTCPIYYLKQKEKNIDYKNEENNSLKKFIFMSSIAATSDNYKELIEAGRRRWKIENEGFNVQKNNGFGLHHKMNRTNLLAMCNYYACLQIAHLFDQLLTLSINSYVHCWNSIKIMWQYFTAALLILTDYQPTNKNNLKFNYRY